MLQRLLPHPWLSLILMIMWLLLTNSLAPGHWLLGALLGWAIGRLADRWLVLGAFRLSRPDLILRLSIHVLFDIVKANVEVAIMVLGPTARLRPAFIVVPLDVEHELATTALISIVSLSPGTLCAELSDDRRALLVHVLDLEEEAALVELIKSRYETPLKEIFQCLPS
ncbi:Na+/H+ antiporter subunit E [Cupriavidus necator]|jgi:multicomponent K+:H+ antiporter subunit E|uniref:Multisubunit Na+/H+ antiporter, MnhE subunit n=4 Tax=Pseudomonadota TaxID=1224 RepID=Q0KAJ2_CUPNH|nr:MULTISPECIES: Na+/H+ antiporter subunit E [Cupriavidus]RWA49481.1 cation:proton antiporter [Cupriavidus sp. UYMSc13B]AEI77199.1 multisubunit Na+/H+ antiporter, MnhE subunit [Cupriavidus necator N-1]EON18976.1 monovalent cation/H+ antiporter subunit E [Cupriavidus sp. GA3-3]EYS97061.1 cation:proton antiporter [Cupriavidus sp. SK-4]KAI3607239.1 Na(+) H(+) antiporter subunit E [Cupriavidus necator H850]